MYLTYLVLTAEGNRSGRDASEKRIPDSNAPAWDATGK